MADEHQRRFIRVPVATIQSCVERCDVNASEEVPSGLAEDVSFRIRQIAESACQFMHHSKRRCLTVEDMDKAMKYSGLEPLHGHHSELSKQYGTLALDQVASVASPAETLPDHTLPNHTPLVTAAWQVVEGVKLEDREVLQGTVQLSKELSESHQSFLSLLLEAATGEDEDKRRIALAAVQSKPAVASILPSFMQYLQQTLTNWEHLTPAQLQRVLKLCLALYKNSALFLDPYTPSLYPLLKDTLLSHNYLDCEGPVTHWHMRAMGGAAMAELLRRYASPLNMYGRELSAHYEQLFSHPQPSSLPVLYGALHVLLNLGCASIAEVLVPHLETIVGFLNASADSVRKEDLFRLQETVLVVAKTLLTSDQRVPVVLNGKSSVGVVNHTPPNSGDITSSTAAQSSASVVEDTTIFGHSALAFSSAVVNGASGTTRGIEGERSPIIQEPPGSPSSSSPLTLYDYLTDIVGEGLTLSLTPPAHASVNTAPSPKTNPSANTQTAKSKRAISEHVTRSLGNFLSREGFKPVKVERPHRTPPPPLSQEPGEHLKRPFNILQTVLPVGGNVLEQQRSHAHSRSRGRGGSKQTAGVEKGTWPGHRRHYIAKSGTQCPVDLGSSWL